MYTLVIHGGAGALSRDAMTPEIENSFRSGLSHALNIGEAILKRGGSSLDAVEAAVKELEDCPLFNAGRGSNFTFDGINEMDASIMEGATLRAGAVSMVRRIKNPISLARKLLDKNEHVLLTAEGAQRFARECRIAEVSDDYFHTDFRWRAMLRNRDSGSSKLSEDVVPDGEVCDPLDKKFGTVGAVAMDIEGNLAAATSTGGTTAKYPGRVGDSAIIGSGTYANNETCAISCTGHGEYFIRNVTAHEISNLMMYKGMSLNEAADEVVHKQLIEMGGRGGVIGVDTKGNIAVPFNTPGMYHAYITSDGQHFTGIFKDEGIAAK
ncbi:MAG: isoaspartyl peptidase/L-asparaginase [Opitutales bacterium]|nr:isoaspartyl peptidase/L-asparaginase [Opitutales bacterium]